MTTVDLSQGAGTAARKPVGAGLNFLWLELTNRCNLQCVHCYTESSPHTGDRDRLTADDYLSVMNQAYALGCRRMQFIGGEPQLNRDFQRLLVASKEIGFEFVEVFTNLTLLNEETVRFAQRAGIRFATSVYSDKPESHQAVTRNAASHSRTIRNLKRLIDSDVATRAAVIQLDQEPAEIERTKRFLADLGVGHVRDSRVRAFGRGEEVLAQPTEMSELCGHCWSGRLCVAPDGNAYPCVMARQWPAGNVLETPLAQIVHGRALTEVRTTIHDTVWLPKLAASRPAAECPQSCIPDTVTPTCPQSCDPLIVVCEPTEAVEEEPVEEEPVEEECPQSCIPDTVTPTCPQSCDPFIVVCEPTEPVEEEPVEEEPVEEEPVEED